MSADFRIFKQTPEQKHKNIEIMNTDNKNTKKFNISTYRTSEDEVLSIYVCSDYRFDEDEAFDALFDALLDSEYGDFSVDFIEFDESVAQHKGYKYCAIFHENEEK